MDLKRFYNNLVVIVLVVILISGCSSIKPSPTLIPTTQPTSQSAKPTTTSEGLPVIEVTFSGEECSYLGPETIPTGKVSLLLHNPGDEDYWAVLAFWPEDKTLEDVVAHFGPPGTAKNPPMWLDGATNSAYAGETTERSLFLLPGEYVLLCVLPDPLPMRHWMGPSVTVEK